MKLYHYKTASGFRHGKADEFIELFSTKVDLLLEQLQGLHSNRLTFSEKSIPVIKITDKNVCSILKKYAKITGEFKFESKDVSNTRDELEGILHQYGYLFTFN